MQAFQFVESQKPAELREVPVPSPGPGQVLIKIGGAGACHSDLHILEAPPKPGPARAPFTLGHENAGWVEKLGPGATGFAVGDPVIAYGPWGCGLCMNCRVGRENYCQNPGNIKAGGLGSDGGIPLYEKWERARPSALSLPGEDFNLSRASADKVAVSTLAPR